ncbi:MAG TPA: cytochrome c maturation protein CcmE [Micromonosporaceae bacterium]|nr:cytochrome c maturation protein CcmE [Micromonosporaceae bacterium]
MSQDLLDPPEVVDPPARGWRGPRLRLVACLLVVAGALLFVAVRGLTGNFVYYLTPTDVVADHKAHVGQRVRLGGYVVPGSVAQGTSSLTFTVTDGTYSMHVSDTGSVPELFKAGQGVVLEGSLGSDGLFHSDTLLVQHNGDYRPPGPGDKPPDRADLVGGS